MSLADKRTKIRKEMFRAQARVTWAPTDAAAKKAFERILELREAYRKAGGAFKK